MKTLFLPVNAPAPAGKPKRLRAVEPVRPVGVLGGPVAGVLCAVLGVVCSVSSGAEDLGKLEKELRQAISTRQIPKALALTHELAETGDPAAYDILIRRCLVGNSYKLERRVGQLLVDCADPEVRALVFAELGSRKMSTFKRRIILLAVAARIADDAQALAAIHGALKDPSRAVVLTSLSWIRKLRKKEFIEPLIGELEIREKRPRDRIYFDILKALREITSADLELSADWKSYLKSRKNGSSAVPKKKEKSLTVVHRPSFFEVAVDTDRVLFLIDVSESMKKHDAVIEEGEPRRRGRGNRADSRTKVSGGGKEKKEVKKRAPSGLSRQRLARVKKELIKVIQQLGSSTRFGVASFSHEIKWMGGTKTLRLARAGNKAAAITWVRSLRAYGATRTDQALAEALAVDVDTVYLLTDGAPKDVHDTRLPIERILAQTKVTNRFLRNRIHTVSFLGVKDSRMKRFVKTLAAQNDGECKLLP
jgi:hypothetical protein